VFVVCRPPPPPPPSVVAASVAAEELQEKLLAWEELTRREEALAVREEKVRISEKALQG
jgi:hypothetical protein